MTWGSNTGAVFFQDDFNVWTTDYTSSNSLNKFQWVGDTVGWSPAFGFPLPAAQKINATLTLSNGQGLTGYADAVSGHYTIVYATSNALVKYDTVNGNHSLLAMSCPGTLWRGLSLPPLPPSLSPSPSVSASRSPTASGSATSSASASNSHTRSVTPSASITPSGTVTATPSPTASLPAGVTNTATSSLTPSSSPTASSSPTGSVSVTATLSSSLSTSPTAALTPSITPTGTPSPSTTPLCYPAAATPAPFSLGSMLALRLGDGHETNVGVSVTHGFLDEFDPYSGTRLQSISLGPSCVFDSARAYGPNLHTTPDGTSLVLACWSTPVGALISSSNTKVVALMSPTGAITKSQSFTSSSSGHFAAATVDSSNFWVVSASYVDYLVGSTTTHVSATGSFHDIALAPGSNTFYIPSSAGLLTLSGVSGALPTTTSAVTSSLGTTGTPGSLLIQDAATLWTTDYSGGGSLSKYTLSSGGTWSLASGYPLGNALFTFDGVAYNVSNAWGLIGFSDPLSAHYTIVYSAKTWLIKYDTVTGVYTGLVSGCAGTQWRGMSLSPQAPSASPTPTVTASATPTATSTRSVSPSASLTVSHTGSSS